MAILQPSSYETSISASGPMASHPRSRATIAPGHAPFGLWTNAVANASAFTPTATRPTIVHATIVVRKFVVVRSISRWANMPQIVEQGPMLLFWLGPACQPRSTLFLGCSFPYPSIYSNRFPCIFSRLQPHRRLAADIASRLPNGVMHVCLSKNSR